MAKDTLNSKASPSNPGGMNDNSPAEEVPSWYQTNGVHSQSQQYLERKTGNLLTNRFDGAILNIHGDLKDRIFVETTHALYMLGKVTDAVPLFITGDDDAVITGDDDLPVTE
jgi:hypothetical protein